MQSSRKIFGFLLAGILILGTNLFAGGNSDRGGARRERLTIAIANEPQTMGPYTNSNQNGFLPATLIFNTLIKKDDQGAYVPSLAKEWTFTDPTTIVFKLRDDVTFHDGGKFTAEDVKFSLTKLGTSSFTTNLFGIIDTENLRIIDPYTIQVKLKAPYAPIQEAFASFRGLIVSKNAYEKAGEAEFGRAPVGSGPFRFVRWVSGDRIELAAFEGYWGEKLPYDNVTFRVIVEASSRAIELESGGVDIAFEILPSDRERLANGKNTRLVTGQSQQVTFITINNSLDPFKDRRIREALAYGINLDALVKTVWQGTALPADSFMPANIAGYKKVGPRPYDAVRAKQLLAEAGYPDGLDVIYYTYENTTNLAVAEVLNSMWAQAGFRVKVQVVDLPTFTSMNNAGQITLAHLSTVAAIADPDAALLIWPLARTISVRHNDQKVEDFLAAGKVEYDPVKRAAIYSSLMDYLFQQCYTIPVAFPGSAFGTSASIDLPFSPNLVPDFTKIRIVR